MSAVTMPSSRWLDFSIDWPANRKTAIVVVRSARHGDVLGEIRWFGRWRQYAFYPRPDSVWNPQCLLDINACIDALAAARLQ